MKKILLSCGLLFPMLFLAADPADPGDHTTWQVTPNSYEYSMTVTTALVFDMEESRDVNDKIAAFAGEDCRGVASPITYVPEDDRYLAHLLVYSNEASGDTVRLFMYDASADELVEIAEPLQFASNAAYGSVDDPYLSRTSYDLTFFIHEGGTGISGATVFLDGYGERETGAGGEVTYPDVFPSDSIYYTIRAGGYEDYTNSLSLVDSDLTRSVDMSLESYDVAFHITNGVIPVESAVAELEGYGMKEADVYGNVVFTDVIENNEIPFNVSGEAYYGMNDVLTVAGEDVFRKVTLAPRSHNVTFRVFEGETPVEGVEVTATSNAENLVYDVVEDALPEGFATEGNAAWKADTAAVYQGTYSLGTGTIYDNQVSELSFSKYTREGEVTFYVKTSTEEGSDYLSFSIDGEEQQRWSGEGPWISASFPVQEGTHTFEWVYRKDGSFASGEDRVWIDYLVIPPEDSVVSEQVTGADGEAVFYNRRHGEKMEYTLYSEEHEALAGSIDPLNEEATVDLELEPVYNLAFSVVSDDASGRISVKDAVVELTGTDREESTDRYGEVVFDRVSVSDSIGYRVAAEGYEPAEGTVSVTNSDRWQEVVLELIPQLEAANLISPNSDGINDYWEIYHPERYKEFTVEIYSGSGELIYSTTDYENNKWDGTVHGREIPDGIYYYIVKNPTGSDVFKGIINLIN